MESTSLEQPLKTVDSTKSTSLTELNKPFKTIDLTNTADPSAEEELLRGAQPIEQRILTKVDTAVQDTTLTLHSVENDEFTTIRQVVTTEVTTEVIETTEPTHLVGTYDLTSESPRNDEESQQPVSPRTEAALLNEGVQQTSEPAIEPSNAEKIDENDDEGEDDNDDEGEDDEDDEDL
ncbi:transcription initiation factor TFIID subunit 11-like [Planococcus citri]|uniref:transcription initiation factor TFIID subunit 11-like n=1 Tax=Planococcus citri TaxID=170843 RepID=UPI0031F8E930